MQIQTRQGSPVDRRPSTAYLVLAIFTKDLKLSFLKYFLERRYNKTMYSLHEHILEDASKCTLGKFEIYNPNS